MLVDQVDVNGFHAVKGAAVLVPFGKFMAKHFQQIAQISCGVMFAFDGIEVSGFHGFVLFKRVAVGKLPSYRTGSTHHFNQVRVAALLMANTRDLIAQAHDRLLADIHHAGSPLAGSLK